VLSDAGVLSNSAEDRGTQIRERLLEPVLDLCVQDRHPLIVTGKRQDGHEWTLLRRAKGRWSVRAVVQADSDYLIALDCAADRVTLLTTRRLVDVGKTRQSAVVLSGKLQYGRGLVAAVHGTPDHVFVGFNAGEWGGGLRRIDRRSGQITTIERKTSGEFCRRPLDTDCDPVNGIASEPWRPECIALAIGLEHMVPHGRVVEVCGDTMEQLYVKPYGRPGRDNPMGADGEPLVTVAFFGLTSAGDAICAAGLEGIYRIGAGGTAQMTPMPTFKKIGDIGVSFDLPHLILVRTSVNQHHSVRGGVPMLVPR
jgi:hypothetical protein